LPVKPLKISNQDLKLSVGHCHLAILALKFNLQLSKMFGIYSSQVLEKVI